MPGNEARRLIGQIISGRYRIEDLVGEGGMGAVYRAEHLHMHKRLAVKVLHASVVRHDEIVERFQREAIAGAHVDHPNVAAAIDFGQLEDGSHFLVLEFLEGEDLRSVIGRGPIAPVRAMKIAKQIALAMRAAHQIGIVHRDLKPENVMLVKREGDDFVKVLDFGISKVPVGELARHRGSLANITKIGMVYGTPEYIAPEQALGEDVDARADLYSIGVILYEMLSGHRPFDDADRAALFAAIAAKAPPPLGPTLRLPAGLEKLVMKLLEKSAMRRPQNAEAVIEALDAIDPNREAVSPAPPVVRESRATSNATRMEIGRVPSSVAITHASVDDEETERPHALERLAAAMPGGLREVPPQAILGGAGILAIVIAIFALSFTRSEATFEQLEAEDDASATPTSSAPSSSSTSPSARPATTSAPSGKVASNGGGGSALIKESGSAMSGSELDTARAGGLAALGPLAQKYPADPAVLRALLLAYAADKSYPPAIGVAKRLAEVSPDAVMEAEVKQVIVVAAGAPDASAPTFDWLMTSGARGADMLYEIAISPTAVKPAHDRASFALDAPAIVRVETPALKVANDLRKALPCARRAFFARAKTDGDARAVHWIKPLAATTGCGFFHRGDCYACFGPGHVEVRETLEAIAKRGVADE